VSIPGNGTSRKQIPRFGSEVFSRLFDFGKDEGEVAATLQAVAEIVTATIPALAQSAT